MEEKKTKNRIKIISSPTSESNHCQNMFPESWRHSKKHKKTKNNSSTLTSVPPLGLTVRYLLFFFSLESFLRSASHTDPCRISKPGKAAVGPGWLALRHRYTDGTLPRHCILSGESHVIQLDACVAFTGCRWKNTYGNDENLQKRCSLYNYWYYSLVLFQAIIKWPV